MNRKSSDTFKTRFTLLVQETVSKLLIEQGMKAYDKLTDKEKEEFDPEDNYRFPKVLLNAMVDSELFNYELGAESVEPLRKKVKRILKNRRI